MRPGFCALRNIIVRRRRFLFGLFIEWHLPRQILILVNRAEHRALDAGLQGAVQCALVHDGDADVVDVQILQGLQRDLAQLVAVLVDDGAFEEKSILPSPGSTVTMQSLDSRVPAVAAFLISMLFPPWQVVSSIVIPYLRGSASLRRS